MARPWPRSQRPSDPMTAAPVARIGARRWIDKTTVSSRVSSMSETQQETVTWWCAIRFAENIVLFVVYLFMPMATRLFAAWLSPTADEDRP